MRLENKEILRGSPASYSSTLMCFPTVLWQHYDDTCIQLFLVLCCNLSYALRIYGENHTKVPNQTIILIDHRKLELMRHQVRQLANIEVAEPTYAF